MTSQAPLEKFEVPCGLHKHAIKQKMHGLLGNCEDDWFTYASSFLVHAVILRNAGIAGPSSDQTVPACALAGYLMTINGACSEKFNQVYLDRTYNITATRQ